MKVGKEILGTGVTDLTLPSGKKEDDGWAKFERILTGLNELLTHYSTIQGKPNIEQKSNKTMGVNMDKLVEFCIKFCENLEKEGMSDKPIGQVISEMPLPVKAVTQLLYAVKAKMTIDKQK